MNNTIETTESKVYDYMIHNKAGAIVAYKETGKTPVVLNKEEALASLKEIEEHYETELEKVSGYLIEICEL
jgi:hypothetical protein